MVLVGAASDWITFGPLFGFLALPSGRVREQDLALPPAGCRRSRCCWPTSNCPNRCRRKARKRHASCRLFLAAQCDFNPVAGAIDVGMFICILAFAGVLSETTIAMLVKGEAANSPFQFSFRQVCLTFAFIGLTHRWHREFWCGGWPGKFTKARWPASARRWILSASCSSWRRFRRSRCWACLLQWAWLWSALP